MIVTYLCMYKKERSQSFQMLCIFFRWSCCQISRSVFLSFVHFSRILILFWWQIIIFFVNKFICISLMLIFYTIWLLILWVNRISILSCWLWFLSLIFPIFLLLELLLLICIFIWLIANIIGFLKSLLAHFTP